MIEESNGLATGFNDELSQGVSRLQRSFDTQEKQFQATRDDVNALKSSQIIVQRDLATLNNSINALAAKIEERSKTNWPALTIAASMSVPMVGLLGFVVTIYISAAMAPISTSATINAEKIAHLSDSMRVVEGSAIAGQAADANSRVDRAQLNDRLRAAEVGLATEISDRRSNTASTKVALAEVETQLRAICSTENLRAAQQERLNSLMWEKSHPGERYPNGTFFTPCIAHDGDGQSANGS